MIVIQFNKGPLVLHTAKFNNPQIIWADIKDIIKDIIYDNKEITDKEIHDRLCKYNDYFPGAVLSDVHVNYEIYIVIDSEKNEVNCHAYQGKRIAYEDKYRFNIKTEGNCVDDFIERGIVPRIDIICNLMGKIHEGRINRVTYNEYHNTWQYEQDFGCISLIREHAQRIVENCNKQLEALADKYTKF